MNFKLRPESFRHRAGAVRGVGVNDHDFRRKFTNGFEAARKIALFIQGDDRHGKRQSVFDRHDGGV